MISRPSWHTQDSGPMGTASLLKAPGGPSRATPAPAHTMRVWKAGADTRHHPARGMCEQVTSDVLTTKREEIARPLQRGDSLRKASYRSHHTRSFHLTDQSTTN